MSATALPAASAGASGGCSDVVATLSSEMGDVMPSLLVAYTINL